MRESNTPDQFTSPRWAWLLPVSVCRFLLHVIDRFPGLVKLSMLLLIIVPTVLLVAVGWKVTGELRGGMLFLALAAICAALLRTASSTFKRLRDSARK